jgi:DNA-binding MarR family transcriptional regulator
MEADGRLQLVPDYDDSEDDLSRDAVETGFTVLLEIWHSALEELGGEVAPLRVLLIVSRARRVSLGRLADALGASVPATNRICARMEAAGLVGRGRGAAQGRVPTIILTASGRRLVTQVQAQRRAVLDHVLESLTPAGRAALASALTELAAS